MSSRDERLEVLKKIELYEKEGRFSEDVENDPPYKELKPSDVDYLNSNPINYVKNFISKILVHGFNRKMKKYHNMKFTGIENLKDIKSGAVVTSNHFSTAENLAVMNAVKHTPSKHRFYRVIREGNYFMKGVIGFCLKNDDTLPLSSNKKTMVKFINTVDALLQQGAFILIYPEQSMWWNYKKIRPFQNGAFHFASKNNVPVIPCFTTLKESDVMDEDGFPIMHYTTHILSPIYPDGNLSVKENIAIMKEKNYNMCKAKYEEVYGKKMEY